MDFNWKFEQIIRNAPKEESANVLGEIDLLFRQYGKVKPESSKKLG